jgi:hypothetical protein
MSRFELMNTFPDGIGGWNIIVPHEKRQAVSVHGWTISFSEQRFQFRGDAKLLVNDTVVERLLSHAVASQP